MVVVVVVVAAAAAAAAAVIISGCSLLCNRLKQTRLTVANDVMVVVVNLTTITDTRGAVM